jgi:hypothetical protein
MSVSYRIKCSWINGDAFFFHQLITENRDDSAFDYEVMSTTSEP